MKRAVFTMSLIGLLVASSSFALDHSQMHEMMIKEGGAETGFQDRVKDAGAHEGNA